MSDGRHRRADGDRSTVHGDRRSPDDLPDRIVRVVDGVGGAVPAGTLRRRLARDGLDGAKRVVVETADDLAEAGRLEREPWPTYRAPDG